MSAEEQGPPVLPNSTEGTGMIPESSDSGQVGGRWHAPHKFATWLASKLQDAGAEILVRVDFRPDGILALSYSYKKNRVPIFLVVGRRGSKGEITRFGTLFAPLPCAPEIESLLVRHTAKRLDEIFRGIPPTWLTRKPYQNPVLGWGPSFLQDYCQDLLLPGVTHYQSTLFQDAQFDEDHSLLLSFRGSSSFNLRLCPSTLPTKDPWVAQFGPLVLVAPEKSLLAHPFVSYVGFAFSLLIPTTATLLPYDSSQQDWTPLMGDTRGEDTFLVGHFRTSEELYKAIFAAKAKIAVVGNLDRECSSNLRWLAGPTEDAVMDFWHINASRDAIMSFRSTDISDTDVIAIDGESKTADLIRQVLEIKPDLLVVQGGCPSALMGETGVRSVDEALEGIDSPPPAFTLDVCLEENNDYRRLWDLLVQLDHPEEAIPTSDRLNLVGFGHERTRGLAELVALLREADVTDVHSLIPTFDMASVKGLASARATVVYPADHVVNAFSMARRHFEQRVSFPEAPWGIQGTQRWLEAVLRAMGRSELPGETWDSMIQRRAPENWAQLRSQASQHRIGFAATAHYLLRADSHLRHGMPLAQLLHELGFGIDLIVLPPMDSQPRRVPDSTLGRWGNDGQGNSVRVVYGAFGESLHDLLERTDPIAFYSEWVGDERLLRAGKQPFSVADLHMGLEGALRNQKFLLQLSSLPFSRRYGRKTIREKLNG